MELIDVQFTRDRLSSPLIVAGEHLGASGSGKTTLLNLIGCLDRPTTGTICIGGIEVTRLGQRQLTEFRRDSLGLIFQHFYLIPYLTAVENVVLAQFFHSMPDEGEARQMLERVGLQDRLHHLPSQLSGGEEQRVCIARAMINQPMLLLADEPTGNLDAENEAAVMAIFHALHREGRTIVMVTHDDAIGAQAQRIVRLQHGRVVGQQLNRTLREAAIGGGGNPALAMLHTGSPPLPVEAN